MFNLTGKVLVCVEWACKIPFSDGTVACRPDWMLDS